MARFRDAGGPELSLLKDVFTGVITIREAHFAMQKFLTFYAPESEMYGAEGTCDAIQVLAICVFHRRTYAPKHAHIAQLSARFITHLVPPQSSSISSLFDPRAPLYLAYVQHFLKSNLNSSPPHEERNEDPEGEMKRRWPEHSSKLQQDDSESRCVVESIGNKVSETHSQHDTASTRRPGRVRRVQSHESVTHTNFATAGTMFD
ncbi:hypothetical protein C8R45DRAFT_926968 [Mycena sanguinolenta]|nr:hypothetical protein C8R45DRAFT_926968 [Mycena sanguinolenta]